MSSFNRPASLAPQNPERTTTMRMITDESPRSPAAMRRSNEIGSWNRACKRLGGLLPRIDPTATKKTTTAIVVALVLTMFGAGNCVGQSSDDAATSASPAAVDMHQDAPASNDSLRAMILTSRAAREAVAKIRPSLVTIESFGGVSAVQGKIGGIRKRGEGNTTGILVSPEGHIITSTFNFIGRPPVITVRTWDGKRHVAKMLGRDDIRKLTMLKIDADQPFPVPEFVPVEELRVGQWAVSVGVGYGDTTPAVSIGIISALNRIGGRAVQTDANISPANYGGPLIDLQGRVIGVCVPLNPQSDSLAAGVEWYDSGIGFCIPLAGGEDWIEMLKQGKRVAPGHLGILAMANPDGPGLFLERVFQDSPAGKAGLLREDIILAVDDQTTDELRVLKNILGRKSAGESIKVRYREFATGEEKTIEVTLGESPESDQNAPPGSRPPQ